MSKRKILAGVLGVCLLASIALPCFAKTLQKTVKVTLNPNTKETPNHACYRACGHEAAEVMYSVNNISGAVSVTCTCDPDSKGIDFEGTKKDMEKGHKFDLGKQLDDGHWTNVHYY